MPVVAEDPVSVGIVVSGGPDLCTWRIGPIDRPVAGAHRSGMWVDRWVIHPRWTGIGIDRVRHRGNPNVESEEELRLRRRRRGCNEEHTAQEQNTYQPWDQPFREALHLIDLSFLSRQRVDRKRQ